MPENDVRSLRPLELPELCLTLSCGVTRHTSPFFSNMSEVFIRGYHISIIVPENSW